MGQGSLPTPPTPPQEVFGLKYGGEDIYWEKGGEGPSKQELWPLYLLLHIGCCEFGYSAQTKRWEPFTQEWRLPASPWLPRVTAVVPRAFFSCCPGYFDIPYCVTWLVICLHQPIVYTGDFPLVFCSHTGFIWPTQGFFKPLIGCRHLNTGKFYIKTWISSFLWLDLVMIRSKGWPLDDGTHNTLQFNIIPTWTSLFISVSSLIPSDIELWLRCFLKRLIK